MSEKTSNYSLHEDCSYMTQDGEMRTLPAGSFVKPIEFYYLPSHIKNNKKLMYNFDSAEDVFAYTSAGIVRLRRASMSKVD